MKTHENLLHKISLTNNKQDVQQSFTYTRNTGMHLTSKTK